MALFFQHKEQLFSGTWWRPFTIDSQLNISKKLMLILPQYFVSRRLIIT